jgi:hypothetical protein
MTTYNIGRRRPPAADGDYTVVAAHSKTALLGLILIMYLH